MDDLRVAVEVPDLSEVRRAVRLTDHVRLFPWFTAKATGAALAFDVELEAKFEDGRFRVQWLTARKRKGGEGISNEGLRAVPVAEILQQAVEKIRIEGHWQSGSVDFGPSEERSVRRSSRDGPSEEDLVEVAWRYRLAYTVSVPPTAYVAKKMRLSQSTAARWVRKAREADHLGPAIGTRAGEGERP